MKKLGAVLVVVAFLMMTVMLVVTNKAVETVETHGLTTTLQFEGNLEVRDGDWVKKYPISTHQVTVLRPDESDPALRGTVDISVHRIDQEWELGDSYKIPEKELLKIRGVVRVVILRNVEP